MRQPCNSAAGKIWNIWNAACLFVALQVYFASNTLSFGLWKSSERVFEYMLIYYGFWLSLLTVLACLVLMLCRRLNRPRLALAALILLSLPFSWQLWVRSLEFDSLATRYLMCLVMLPVMHAYFRIGLARVREVAGVAIALCAISLASHAGIEYRGGPSPLSDDGHLEFAALELDNRPNVHVVMLDALASSSFTEEFMGFRNPAADRLASLDDALYAGAMGFSEQDATKEAWGALFNLGQDGTSRSFSGVSPSRLSALLRANGYRIHTGYSGDYFGWTKGPWVDEYHRGARVDLEGDLSCVTKKGGLKICSQTSRNLFAKLFLESADRQGAEGGWADKIVDLIDQAEGGGARW